MAVTSWVVGSYGVFSLVGGLIGYVKAKSTASLIAGSTSGVLLLVCALGIQRNNTVAAVMSVLIALVLGGRFIGTWRRNHRLMPDFLMVVLSLVTLVSVGAGWLTR